MLNSVFSFVMTYKIESVILVTIMVMIILFIIGRIKEKMSVDDFTIPYEAERNNRKEAGERTSEIDTEFNLASPTEVENETLDATDKAVTAFIAEDVKVLGIHQNMTKEEAEALFGVPIDDQGGFPFGSIVFSSMEGFNTTDTEVFIDQPGFAAPRGIKIGDPVDRVLSIFPSIEEEETFLSETETTLYDIDRETEILTGKVYYDNDFNIESIQFNHISDALWYLELYITNNEVASIKFGCSSVDLEAVKEVLY